MKSAKAIYLEKLKENPENYREIIPSLFRVIDPDKKFYPELVWLQAAPKSLVKSILKITENTLKAIEPEPQTIAELAAQESIGTLFEVTDTGVTYQLAGYGDEMAPGKREVVALPIGQKDLIRITNLDLGIRRIF